MGRKVERRAAAVVAVLAMVTTLAGCGSSTTGRLSTAPAPTTSVGLTTDTLAAPDVRRTLRSQDVLVSLEDVPANVEDHLRDGADRLRDVELATRACTALTQNILGRYVVAAASPSAEPQGAVGDITAESRRLFPHRPDIVEAVAFIGRRYGQQVFTGLRQLDLPKGTSPAEMMEAAQTVTVPADAAVATACAGDAPRWAGPRTISTPPGPGGGPSTASPTVPSGAQSAHGCLAGFEAVLLAVAQHRLGAEQARALAPEDAGYLVYQAATEVMPERLRAGLPAKDAVHIAALHSLGGYCAKHPQGRPKG